MKFSIITPVLNGARFLPEAISSIAAQSYADWEHIIVDGGSDDGSLDIARAWAEKEKRASVVSLPGEGMYAAIFAGFSQATGDILSWLNCDDLYAPWALATASVCFERGRAQWITGLPGVWDAQGRLRIVRPAGAYPPAWIRRGWFHGRFLGCLQQESMFFSKRLIEGLAPSEREKVTGMRLAGDFELWRLFARRARLEIVPSAIAGFRIHGANMSALRHDEYLHEVRSAGAPFPPRPVATIAEFLFRVYSAVKMQWVIEKEDRSVKVPDENAP